MMRLLLIGLAILAATVTMLLTRSYLANQEQRLAQTPAPTVEVLVAATDLEVGQPVSERNLVWQPWPRDRLNPNYLVRDQQPDAIRQLTGAAARQPLFAGEPVTRAKLVKRDGASVLAVVLREGYRAVTIKVDEAQGLAGLVKPGDQVDVLLTHKVTVPGTAERGERAIAEVIARGVRVLGVGQEITGDGDRNKPAKSITVEVDPAQAEAIALGRSLGTLSLALRSAFAEASEPLRPQPYTSQEDVSAALREQRAAGELVLVAARRLEAGTLLGDADVAWARADGRKAGADLIAARTQAAGLRGALLLRPLEAGEALKRGDVVRPTDSRFVPLALRPGYRAVSVAIASNSAVGGFISPGDYVDVIFTGELEDQSQGAALRRRSWSETVAAGVRVLSIETSLDPKTQLPTVGGTVTLETTPHQAEEIALAANMGKLTFTLRPAGDDGRGLGRELAAVTAPAAAPVRRPGFTVDTEMSRGLGALVSGAGDAAGLPAGDGMVVIRGTARSIVSIRD